MTPTSYARRFGMVSTRGFTVDQVPSLEDKVAVITGGQSGIGREVSTLLLLNNIGKIYILARTISKYEDAKRDWVEQRGLGKDSIDTRTEFIQCDLSDITSVKQVASDLLRKLDRLDVLFNNAALPTLPDYKLSPQGIENIFATNHVGHFVLTNILLPLIEKTAAVHDDARIVNTSSALHVACQELDFSLLTSPKRTKSPVAFDAVWRYGRSKLANILFTRELALQLANRNIKGVYANAFYPGNVPTEAMDSWKLLVGNVPGQLFKAVFKKVGQSLTDAAATAMYLGTSSAVAEGDKRGRYFVPIATEESTSSIAESQELAKQLWQWTDEQVTKILGEDWSAGTIAEIKSPPQAEGLLNKS